MQCCTPNTHSRSPLPCSTSAVAPAAFIGATISAGVSGGVLFTAAHELVRCLGLVFWHVQALPGMGLGMCRTSRGWYLNQLGCMVDKDGQDATTGQGGLLLLLHCAYQRR